MDQTPQYMALISEIIAKQSVVLGPSMALMRARKVPGLQISDDGKVLDIKGEGRDALQNLIKTYTDLSGAMVKNYLSSIFGKYPEIKTTS